MARWSVRRLRPSDALTDKLTTAMAVVSFLGFAGVLIFTFPLMLSETTTKLELRDHGIRTVGVVRDGEQVSGDREHRYIEYLTKTGSGGDANRHIEWFTGNQAAGTEIPIVYDADRPSVFSLEAGVGVPVLVLYFGMLALILGLIVVSILFALSVCGVPWSRLFFRRSGRPGSRQEL
ncbi:hypothetical protein GCM10017600_00460 [Streptosporangium carneum]|uniref:DUF3592 domain-containing protein n=2 Tax=Streptosporangium carneum TaxID=47481 RepID=A0A9W6MA39_9ACTN|nr:hypothetical protein GCM10017600_00460 [Streptosporangium carneum]